VRKEVGGSEHESATTLVLDDKTQDHKEQRLDSPQTDIKRGIEIPRILVQLFLAQRLFLDGRPGESEGGDVVLLALFFRHVVVSVLFEL
jgi:hypothetical protein